VRDTEIEACCPGYIQVLFLRPGHRKEVGLEWEAWQRFPVQVEVQTRLSSHVLCHSCAPEARLDLS
jgi:hypothetical protein